MTTSTYEIVHIPDNTPELSPDVLGQHVTIRRIQLAGVVDVGLQRQFEAAISARNVLINSARTAGTLRYASHDRGTTPNHIIAPANVVAAEAEVNRIYDAMYPKCPRCGSRIFDDCGCVLCAGGCGELVPEPDAGDPWCPDCLAATQPADDRAMQAAPPRSGARDRRPA